MPRSHDAALEKGKCIFDGIGVNLAHDVDLAAMVNGPMWDAREFCGIGIRSEIVRDNHVNIGFDVLADVLRESSCFHIVSMEEPQIAVSLPNADHDFFVVSFCRMALTDVPAAYVGFVHLYRAGKFWFGSFFHRGPDSVAEIPCGLVADSKRAVNLMCAYALFRFAEKQRSHEPFLKWQVRVVKNRARRHGKLVIATLAVEQLLIRLKLYSRVIAARAVRSIGPADTAEQFTAFFRRAVAVYQGSKI